jgi:hypothetical protein
LPEKKGDARLAKASPEDSRELGVDLIKDLFHSAGILDQDVNWTQQKILRVEKPTGSTGRVRLRVIGF